MSRTFGGKNLASIALISSLATGGATYTALAAGAFGAPSALMIALGLAGVGGTILSARSSKQKTEVASSSVTPLEVSELLSDDIREKLGELHRLARIYENRGSSLFPAVNGVLANGQKFFERLHATEGTQEARLASVRYGSILDKLNRALGEDYYLDIERHPELWSNRDERMEAVEAALNATGEQIIRNIRQLNSSRDLEFELALESLLALDEAQKNERELGIL